jgi:hypothetical protein
MRIPRDHFDLFLRHRARTIEEFRREIVGDGFQTSEALSVALCTDLYIANVLSFEVPFDAGAADAVLDFGSDVVVFEFKGSLLTHAAKAERNLEAFERDFCKKFGNSSGGYECFGKSEATA